VLGIQTNQALNQILEKRLGVKGVAVERGSAAEAAGLRGAKIERDGGIARSATLPANSGVR
jgi:hypothetical protein